MVLMVLNGHDITPRPEFSLILNSQGMARGWLFNKSPVGILNECHISMIFRASENPNQKIA